MSFCEICSKFLLVRIFFWMLPQESYFTGEVGLINGFKITTLFGDCEISLLAKAWSISVLNFASPSPTSFLIKFSFLMSNLALILGQSRPISTDMFEWKRVNRKILLPTQHWNCSNSSKRASVTYQLSDPNSSTGISTTERDKRKMLCEHYWCFL